MSDEVQGAGGAKRLTHRGYLVGAFSCLFLVGFGDNMRGPLFPEILRELGLSDAQGGLMFAMSCGGSIVGALWARRLVSRWSTVRILQLGLGFAFLGQGGSALAWDLVSLLAGSFVFGIAGGVLALGQNLMVEEGSPPERRRQGLAGLHSTYGFPPLEQEIEMFME